MTNAKIVALAGIVVFASIAALMVATNNTKVSKTSLALVDIKRELFQQWKMTYSVDYPSLEEEEKRFQIWSNNYEFIQEHNKKGNSYTVGMNQFGDKTSNEYFRSCVFNETTKPQNLPLRTGSGFVPSVNGIPGSIDWRQKGAVTPVKNQGSCGSCWAFSTTGSLEGLHAITTNNLVSFSEQQLIDCSESFGNEGCNGGLMDYAFSYTAQNGIEPEKDYPYKDKTRKCKYNSSEITFMNAGHTDVPANKSSLLAVAVSQQPVSIGIEADSMAFQFYTSGIFKNPSCGTNLDHGVLIVGYEDEQNESSGYWIVKNSWGSSWGENGYIRIAKSSEDGPGVCGLAMQASYPTGSSSVTYDFHPEILSSETDNHGIDKENNEY